MTANAHSLNSLQSLGIAHCMSVLVEMKVTTSDAQPYLFCNPTRQTTKPSECKQWNSPSSATFRFSSSPGHQGKTLRSKGR